MRIIEASSSPDAAKRPKSIQVGSVNTSWEIANVELFGGYGDKMYPLKKNDFDGILVALSEGGGGEWETTFPRPGEDMKNLPLETAAKQAARQAVDLCKEHNIPATVEIAFNTMHADGYNELQSCKVRVIRTLTLNPRLG